MSRHAECRLLHGFLVGVAFGITVAVVVVGAALHGAGWRWWGETGR